MLPAFELLVVLLFPHVCVCVYVCERVKRGGCERCALTLK